MDGSTQREIAERLEITTKRNVNASTAQMIVSRVLRGNSDENLGAVYPGLITNQYLLKKLNRSHVSERASITGKSSEENNLGIFELDEDGNRKYLEKAIKAKGLVPWTDVEKEIAYRLSESPRCWHVAGSRKGKRNLELIADILNEFIHDGEEVRFNTTLNLCLVRYRKAIAKSL